MSTRVELSVARALSSREQRSTFIKRLNNKLAPQGVALRALRGWKRDYQFAIFDKHSQQMIRALADTRDVARLAVELGAV